jgi:hypothetical protein
MSRRSKLVYLCSLNAILAAILVALATALIAGRDLSHQPTVICGGMETSESGRFIPVNNSFDSITSAEAFICHEVPYPRSTQGWEFEHISASRSGPAVNVGRGIGFASVTLDYLQPDDPDADMRIEVSPFAIDAITYGIVDQVEVMGAAADLIRGSRDGQFILQWRADGFSFFVEALTTDDFNLEDLFEILNSIE